MNLKGIFGARGAWLVMIVAAIAGLAGEAGAAQTSTVINGTVMGPDHRPAEQVRVTVMDDGYSILASTFTDASGRFQFRVRTSTSYYVDAEPTGQTYKSQRVLIDGGAIMHGGSQTLRVDIELEATNRNQPKPAAGGIVFHQTVPAEARVEYDRAMKLLKDKPDQAYERLRAALKLFPDYYDAMEALGSGYVKEDYLDFAVPILEHAIEINPSGEKSLYALGVAYYKLRRYEEAQKAFTRTSELNPKSVNGALYLGLTYAKLGNRDRAETQLKTAYASGATAVPDLHLALASIYIDTKRYKEAVDQLNTLLREIPDLRDKDKIVDLIDRLKKKSKA
jgi:predicted Zn-dependent protease